MCSTFCQLLSKFVVLFLQQSALGHQLLASEGVRGELNGFQVFLSLLQFLFELFYFVAIFYELGIDNRIEKIRAPVLYSWMQSLKLSKPEFNS